MCAQVAYLANYTLRYAQGGRFDSHVFVSLAGRLTQCDGADSDYDMSTQIYVDPPGARTPLHRGTRRIRRLVCRLAQTPPADQEVATRRGTRQMIRIVRRMQAQTAREQTLRIAAGLVEMVNQHELDVDITDLPVQRAMGHNPFMKDDVSMVNALSDYDSDDYTPIRAKRDPAWVPPMDRLLSVLSAKSDSSSASSDEESDIVDEDKVMAAAWTECAAENKVITGKRTRTQAQRYKPSPVTKKDQRADMNAYAPRRGRK